MALGIRHAFAAAVLWCLSAPAVAQTNAERLMDMMRGDMNSLCSGGQPGTNSVADAWSWFRSSSASAPGDTDTIDDWWFNALASHANLENEAGSWDVSVKANGKDYWNAWCEEIKEFTKGTCPASDPGATAWVWLNETSVTDDPPTVPPEVIEWTTKPPRYVWPWIWWW